MNALNWPALLTKLVAKQDLSRSEANWAMTQIMRGESSEAEIAAFMLAIRSKGETVEELAGLVDVMLENALAIEISNDAVDIVGTGGDMAATVNISTMAAILAATLVPVMKHGSRSASGKTGSSEMLQALGLNLELAPKQVAKVFSELGITFFFAPVFHPAMKHVAPIRKRLGIPTTFNFLGPLANPAQPLATSLGVAKADLAPLLAEELSSRGRYAMVFRGQDGLDELTTTSASDIWLVEPAGVLRQQLNPADLGLSIAKTADLVGGDAYENAAIAREIFSGKHSGSLARVRDVVILNAAGGVVAYRAAKAGGFQGQLINAFAAAINELTAALDSGAAEEKLNSWVAATNR